MVASETLPFLFFTVILLVQFEVHSCVNLSKKSRDAGENDRGTGQQQVSNFETCLSSRLAAVLYFYRFPHRLWILRQ